MCLRQDSLRILRSSCFLFVVMCLRQDSLRILRSSCFLFVVICLRQDSLRILRSSCFLFVVMCLRQDILRILRSNCFLFVVMCLRQDSLRSRCIPKYFTSSGCARCLLFSCNFLIRYNNLFRWGKSHGTFFLRVFINSQIPK